RWSPEPDDPFSFEAVRVPDGDLETMAAAMVEEYARMGWNEVQILDLFRRPFFSGTYRFLASRGEAATRSLIHGVLERTGVYRYTEDRCDG
ncbi:MAG: hypothetical protein ACE5ID_06750, partial [Acidobacteriota bacterium]